MNEDIMCIGCGAVLQSQNSKKAGYLPASALKSKIDKKEDIYCQRCFRLRHYNEIAPINLNNDDFLALLNSVDNKKALIVNVVDLFDFSNSLLTSLKRFIGNNEFVLVGNKFDLFPFNSRQSRIKDWMRQEANRMGLYPKKIFLVSAAKQINLDALIEYLDKVSKNQDIYFVGMTNVGKSTLINSIIDKMGNIKNLITTSNFPGTTLGKIKIPLENGHFLIDSPGIMNKNQLTTRLNAKDLKIVSPVKPLKPTTFQLKPGNTIFLGGLGRIDYLKGDATSFTVYVARGVTLHRTKITNADNYYQKHVGELLIPPKVNNYIKSLKGQEFHTTYKSDLLFGGIGFVTVPQNCVVKTYTPDKIGLEIRRALI